VDLLTEDQARALVRRELEARGWTSLGEAPGHEPGVDLKMSRGDDLLLMEVKGLTSGDSGSARHGQSMRVQQRRHNVAEAVYTACVLRSAHPEAYVAIGLPEDAPMRGRIDAVADVLERLAIAVLWASPSGHVTGELLAPGERHS